MLMTEVIQHFPEQLKFEPTISNGSGWQPANSLLVAGMGGSNLVPDLLKSWQPNLDIISRRNYGLPETISAGRAVIASSYSGNTEETIDAYSEARRRNLPVAVITKGGQLLDMAKADSVPYIQLPDTGIQPRSSIGYMSVALLKLMGNDAARQELKDLANTLRPLEYKSTGKKLSIALRKVAPIIYASDTNLVLATNWKIKFNENSKIPAYAQVFPELNHNEINGFDTAPRTRLLTKKFGFVMFKDSADDPRIQKRMAVTETLYRELGYIVEPVFLTGRTRLEKIFSTLLIGDWTSVFLAKHYRIDPEAVVMVEEFKKRLTQ